MKFISNKITWTTEKKTLAKTIYEKKLSKVIDDLSLLELKLSKIPNESIKLTAYIDGFITQTVDKDFEHACKLNANKLKDIITKNKQKQIDKRQFNATFDAVNKFINDVEDDAEDELITKEKSFKLNPITLVEALDEFDRKDYPFYVYKDIDANNKIMILYRRFDDTIGRISCD